MKVFVGTPLYGTGGTVLLVKSDDGNILESDEFDNRFWSKNATIVSPSQYGNWRAVKCVSFLGSEAGTDILAINDDGTTTTKWVSGKTPQAVVGVFRKTCKPMGRLYFKKPQTGVSQVIVVYESGAIGWESITKFLEEV